jgi:hypothetical protein
VAECAHGTCTCQVSEGASFCSEWCEGHAAEAECHCHHEGCAAPHTH